MKQCRNLGMVLLAALLVLLLPLRASAVGSIDVSREVSLTVKLQCGETALPGAEIAIYRVSAVDAYGFLTPLPAYQDFAQLLDIRGENAQRWEEAAVTIEQHILKEQISPTDKAVTDPQGNAKFPSGQAPLDQGLYLVRSVRHPYGSHVYATSAFFVMLPARDRNEWDYSEYAEAKAEETEELICLRVIKQWDDKYWESKRPSSITVNLYCDEVFYDSITLPINGRWVYGWGGLEASHFWWVEEEAVQDYKSLVYKKGNTFYIKNTYEGSTAEDPQLPQTGQLWWPVPVLMAAGLLLVVLGLMRRRGMHHEK